MKQKAYNIAVCILQLLTSPKVFHPLQTWIDNIIYGIFVLDYIVRFAVAERKKDFFKKNFFDLIAIVPFNSFLRIFRILQISKLLRFAEFTKLFRIGLCLQDVSITV